MIGIGISPMFQDGAQLNLESFIDKMSYRAIGVQSDGLSLNTSIGAGGVLKQLPAYSTGIGTQRLKGYSDSFLMLDGTATYEYYLETVIGSVPASTGVIMYGSEIANRGFRFQVEYGGGYFLGVNDGTGEQGFQYYDSAIFVAGLNKISLKFDLSTKVITVNVNGTTRSHTHSKANVFDVSGLGFAFGGYIPLVAQAAYFKMKKNDIAIKEFVLGDCYKQSQAVLITVSDNIGSDNLYFSGGGTRSFQDLANPYKYGYDLFWHEDTLNYKAVSPISSLGASMNPKNMPENFISTDFQLFKKLLPTELGYHILNYIQMPNLPIFDTTNRTYWKSSITSDLYYVGNTAGKERYFHKTWLDFDWIDSHIETAYKGLFYVQNRWKKAQGQGYVKVKIENIILFTQQVAYSTTRRDIYENENYGYVYQSFFKRSDVYYNYSVMHTFGNKRVALFGNLLKYSADGGETYNAGFDISGIYPAGNINHIRILSNGNICIFSNSKLVHYSPDNLTTIVAASVKNMNGANYVFHTPVNANYPGGYFASFNPISETGGIVVYSNYAGLGASPINFYYSKDFGITWKVFYTFGQHPYHKDDGTQFGGMTGNPVGDAGNPLITELTHGVNIGFDGNFYIFSGEINCHWMKCAYNSVLDTWTVTDLLNAESSLWVRMIAIGGYERNGYIYWACNRAHDFVVNGITYPSKGIWKAAIADINDITKHILLSSPGPDMASLSFINDISCGKVISTFSTVSGPSYVGPYENHFSNDYGETWEIAPSKFNSSLFPTHYNALGDFWGSRKLARIQYMK